MGIPALENILFVNLFILAYLYIEIGAAYAHTTLFFLPGGLPLPGPPARADGLVGDPFLGAFLQFSKRFVFFY